LFYLNKLQDAGSWAVTGLCFSRAGPGLIQHDLTNQEATLNLIKTVRPDLGTGT
jgi:hypothetical protein